MSGNSECEVGTENREEMGILKRQRQFLRTNSRFRNDISDFKSLLSLSLSPSLIFLCVGVWVCVSVQVCECITPPP